MTQIARISDTGNERRLQAERLIGGQALQEAQALRFNVFSGEFNAKLKGAEMGLDMDDYDVHCAHIGVRDLNTGRLVATTRLLDHQAASSLGRFYSEEEFSLHGLVHLKGPILEIGRTCVDPAYRNGGTIAVLWGELAEVLNEGGYSYLMGCASIPMQDGGIQAQAIMQRLRERYLCTEHLQAVPKNPCRPWTCRPTSSPRCRRCSRPTCAWARRFAASRAGTRISRWPTCSSCSSATNSARATPATSRQRSDEPAAGVRANRASIAGGGAGPEHGQRVRPVRTCWDRPLDGPSPALVAVLHGTAEPCPALSVTVHGQLPHRPMLWVSNHVSWTDIPLLGMLTPLSFLSKAEVRTWPVAGWLAAKAGSLFIRRGSGDSQLIRKQMSRHLEQAHPLLMFPEGTTTDGRTLRTFHGRLLSAAIDADVALQPVAIRYLRNGEPDSLAPFIGDDDLLSHLMRLFANDRGEVEIHLLEPIACHGQERAALAFQAQQAVHKALFGALPEKQQAPMRPAAIAA